MKRKKNKLFSDSSAVSQAGYSLLSLLIAMGAGLVVTQIALKLTSRQMDLSQRTLDDYDIASIQRTVISQMDCGSTLNITPTTLLPLSCDSFSPNLPLKRKDGSVLNANGKIGRWDVAGNCVNNEILVGVSRKGLDPITKKQWSELPGATDAFRGASDLCREELGDSVAIEHLSCFVATRRLNEVNVEDGKSAFVEAYSATGSAGETQWGLTCKAPYQAVSCFLDSKGNTNNRDDYDNDARSHENGCNSDDQEWALEYRLHLNCCQIQLLSASGVPAAISADLAPKPLLSGGDETNTITFNGTGDNIIVNETECKTTARNSDGSCVEDIEVFSIE